MKLFYQVEPGSPQERKVIKSAISLAGFSVLLDQITKLLVVEMIKYIGTRIHVIDGFFDLTYITNKGAAWGMLSGKTGLLLAVSIVVFVLITFFLRQICEGWTERYYSLLLVMSGIIGNTFDRVFRGGGVVDFLRFYFRNWEWPSFNVADCAICIGVGMFILSSLLRPDQKKADKGGKKAATSGDEKAS